MRFAFVGANSTPALTRELPLPGVVNYLIGNNPAQWHTDLPTAAHVRYTALYPGIDLTIYGTEGGGLEYDALIAPGADPAAFALAISGADTVRLDDATGELILNTAAGDVRQHAPVAYQERDGQRVPVAARYDLRPDGSVGFAVGAYDPALPLTIDPQVTLVYSTYLGGTEDDEGYGIAVDTMGNAYITGLTYSTDFPTLHPVQATSGGKTDVFVTKYDPSGARVYSTYLGGSGDDSGNAIAVDAGGNAYVTGPTSSTNFPVVNASQPANAGGTDVFVTRLDTIGRIVYSTYLGGLGTDTSNGIAVDASGAASITGRTSGGFPTLNASQSVFGGGGSDAFVTKLSATGARVYSTYLGGSGYDVGNGITVDTVGNAYITGYTSGSFPTLNAFQPTYGGGNYDVFVAKLDANGARVYSTYLGGAGDDEGAGIAVDRSGNAFVTGYTKSTNFPTMHPFQSANAGVTNAFVTKLSTSGALLYGTYLGGASQDSGSAIAVDTVGFAYVTGTAASTNFPTLNAAQPANGGISNAFVAKFNPSGTLVYSTYLGGSGDNYGSAIAVDTGLVAYVTGFTDSTNFPTLNAAQPLYGGGSGDAFVTKLQLVPYSQPTPMHTPAATRAAATPLPQPTPMHTPVATRPGAPLPQPVRH